MRTLFITQLFILVLVGVSVLTERYGKNFKNMVDLIDLRCLDFLLTC